MKILITGSSGQLGSATVQHLRSHGILVKGIDILPSLTTDELVDVKNQQQVNAVTKGFDAVIHTAALHGKHYELNYPRHQFIETNVMGTLHLLNACVANGVKKFLYTSTTSIYGSSLLDNQKAAWVDEMLPEQPRDIYDITKQTTEQLCKDFFYKEGLQTSVYRVGRFLPENDNLKINHRLYRGLDERDGAEAFRLALAVNFNDFQIFNISSGSPFQREDVNKIKQNPKEIILHYYPESQAVYERNNWLFPKSIDRVYVCDKAKQLLGYHPKYTFEYLLNQT